MNKPAFRTMILPGLIAGTILGTLSVAAYATPAEPQEPTTTPAPSQTPAPDSQPEPKEERRRPRFGPEVGVYLPTSDTARNRFGSTWYSIGLGVGMPQGAPTGVKSSPGRWIVDLDVLGGSRSGNRVFIVPIGIEYRYRLGNHAEVTATRPYVGASANYYLTYMRSKQDNIEYGVRGAGGGSAFAGVSFADRGYLEARYRALSEVRGLDLSGFNLRAGVRF